ncbi:hypothetical protein FRB94_011452 [Tulasnella sp. JGI-2019a]|nr:hypothetical protein FRB93_013197 [Tulasnella sp. JGI-2019a]KAG9009759.1 hypothetical protein FRB94_011452 [Tulasnella sp. JGI-2019a]KAG9034577.1 hypothetical protein FRB95_013030 [Tulasnella sp. JGI-2019a]
MSIVNTKQPTGKNDMSLDVSTQPTIDNVEQQVCQNKQREAMRLRGGGAGKDCFIAAFGCFVCFECFEGCCECIGDIICCPCEMCC